MAFLNRIALDRSGRLHAACRRLGVAQFQATSCSPSISSMRENSFTGSRFREGIRCITARFLAVPAQGKPKEDSKSSQGPRLNEAITSKFIRLVTDDGHTVVSREEALNRARKLALDLVEVQRTSTPPVCKIMDYHKEKFKKESTGKERAKTKSESSIRKGDFKEVRLKGKIAQNDIEVKADAVKSLLERGYRVKCMALPSKQRGAEECDLGALLNRLTDLIEDVISVESGPFVEKQQAYVVVRHVKFASKKGSRNKTAKVGEETADSAALATSDGAAAIDPDSSSDSEAEVLPSEPVKRLATEQTSRSGRGVENHRSDQGRTITRRENQETSKRQQLDTGGKVASPVSSYGIFSAPTRSASGDRRAEGLNRSIERNSPGGRQK